MKKNIYSKSLFMVSLVLFFTPFFCNATIIYLSPAQKNINEGDIFVVDVKINSEKSTINVVEGDIVLPNTTEISVKEISLAGSSLTIWPKEPVLSSDKRVISFVGGVPGGLNSSNVNLFKIILEAKKVGITKITPLNIAVYLNDGKATKTKVTIDGSIFNIYAKNNSTTTDEWTSLVSEDKTPPENFVIDIGQESSMFEGKKFAVFTATDKQTGIDYYEVYEGSKEAVRSGNMYVLLNQDTDPVLKVIAYDKAGNQRKSEYPPSSTVGQVALSIGLLIVLFLIIIRIVYLKRKNYF